MLQHEQVDKIQGGSQIRGAGSAQREKGTIKCEWKMEEKNRGRKMAGFLVKAENCLKCQPIVYQRGSSTYSSYHSLPAVSLCHSLILEHTCRQLAVSFYNCTPSMCHLPASSPSRPRCPIRRQWRVDAVFARACQTHSTLPALQAPNTPIIFLPA